VLEWHGQKENTRLGLAIEGQLGLCCKIWQCKQRYTHDEGEIVLQVTYFSPNGSEHNTYDYKGNAIKQPTNVVQIAEKAIIHDANCRIVQRDRKGRV
jgi:hypothetical protein